MHTNTNSHKHTHTHTQTWLVFVVLLYIKLGVSVDHNIMTIMSDRYCNIVITHPSNLVYVNPKLDK